MRRPPTLPVADLVLTVEDSPDPVTAGSSLTYGIAVRNDGPARAVDVLVNTEQLANEFASGTFQLVGSEAAGGCVLEGQAFGCRVGDVAVGATATATVVVRPAVSGAVSVLWFAAPVDPTSRDPDPGNNSVSVRTTVVSG